MCLYFFSKNSRTLLSDWEQWTLCKSCLLLPRNHSMRGVLNIIFSKKPDHKLLPFLVCCYAKYTGINMLDVLQRFFKRFTSNEKQNITVIRSHINTFYSVIVKYLDIFSVIHIQFVIQLIENLPEIKPK